MTYAEALRHLYSFTNYEASAMSPRTDMRLERVRRLMELAGNPQRRFRSVMVGGTKGKGSTAAMLASVAQAAGLRTGLYSTPHLNTHRERLRVDGEMIPPEVFVRLMAGLPSLEEPATTYELGTLIGFEYFAERQVDLAVVEVGLGGRLDATNVLEAEVAIITSISYDHTEILGATLTAIAGEKAGIIKPGKPVISAPQPVEAMTVLERVARQRSSPLTVALPAAAIDEPEKIDSGDVSAVAGQWASFPTGEDRDPERGPLPRRPDRGFLVPLIGAHQLTNAGVAIAAARQLGFGDDAIRAGLERVRWPGRLEIASRQPLVVLDGAHNVDSMEKLAAAIRRHFQYKRLRVIAGFSADKDIPGIAAVLRELAGDIVLVRSHHARSAEPGAIMGNFPGARIAPSLEEAMAGAPDLTLVTGSLYLIGEARLHFGLVSPDDQDEL